REPPRPSAINQQVSAHLENVILRTLCRDPESRHQTALELAADLGGLSASQTHGLWKKTVSRPKSPRIGLRPVAVAVAVAALGVLILVLSAIPPVRHALFGNGASEPQVPGNEGSENVSSPSGLPPLSAGRYVAVLPFRIIGDAQSLDFVADGLGEALTTKLFRFKQLHLASYAEVAAVSNKDPLEKNARTLGVNMIVDGVIQGTPEKMSIIVNVRDATDGKKIWSQQFSGAANDALGLEDQISSQLVRVLDLSPTNEELALSSAHPTENTAAYDLYLRGRNALRGQQDAKNDQMAAAFFARAVQKDPHFALAYSGLADASLAIYLSKRDPFWSGSALSAAQRAQELNDSEAEVHFALGRAYQATGKNIEAIAELQRALKIEPNSDEGYRALGRVYLGTNRAAEGIAAYQKAIEINPYYWMNYNALGVAYFQIGDSDKALAAFHKISEIDPDNSAGYNNAGLTLLQQGKYDECIPEFQKAIALTGGRDDAYSNLGYAYFNLKRYDDAV